MGKIANRQSLAILDRGLNSPPFSQFCCIGMFKTNRQSRVSHRLRNFAFLPPPPSVKNSVDFWWQISPQGKTAENLSLPNFRKLHYIFHGKERDFITWNSLWGRLHVTSQFQIAGTQTETF